MNLYLVEVRRALHRRIVWVLLLLALAGCLFTGIVAFIASNDPGALDSPDSPARMTQWWVAGTGDGWLIVAATFLAFGAAIGGASMAGAEWKAGTITTVLTWEPRRVVLHSARTAAVAVCAFVIAMLLQALFLAALLPAVWTNGTTEGANRDFWISLFGAMVRIGFFATLVAVLAFNLATIGRNTAFALIGLGAYVLVLENLIRSLRPKLGRFLIGENVATVMTWKQLDGAEFDRPPVIALVTLLVYAAVIIGAATVLFRRRDIAGA